LCVGLLVRKTHKRTMDDGSSSPRQPTDARKQGRVDEIYEHLGIISIRPTIFHNRQPEGRRIVCFE